jgi:hypothetical protein
MPYQAPQEHLPAEAMLSRYLYYRNTFRSKLAEKPLMRSMR